MNDYQLYGKDWDGPEVIFPLHTQRPPPNGNVFNKLSDHI